MLGQAEARRDLDDLLVAALHGAVALVQVDDVAVLVAEDLHLDVLRARDVLFEEDRGIAEGAAGLALRFVEQRWRDRSALCTTRMPRPPPPKAALMMSGKPISFAIFSASSRSVTGSSVPGSTGTLIFLASARAAVLSPIMSSSSGRGPTKMMPASAQARANSAFSERKP
jgi:hypothetical protein